MTAKLVKAFNSLPRKEKCPSGMVPNEWHFDIRYIHLEPPSHALVLIQPHSEYIHMERLPVGLPHASSGVVFFPESGKEAAPEVAKAILHFFVNSMGNKVMMGSRAPPPFAPWKLTTDDRTLAVAVGNELKGLGVRSDDVCKVGVSRPSVIVLTDSVFTDVFSKMKQSLFPNPTVGKFVSTPTSIGFEGLIKLDEPPREPNGLANLLLKYVQLWKNCELPGPEDSDSSAMLGDIQQGVAMFQRKLLEKPEATVKAEADRGNPEAALDYGLRLYFGIACKRDRTLARSYIVKAIISPDASDELIATGHGILVEWCVSTAGVDIRSRYLFAASHHANFSAQLSRRVRPNAALPAPSMVLWFMSAIFEPLSHKSPELYLFFKDAVKVMEEREKQVESGRKKVQEKRMKKPNRYRCAAVGCGIEASTGKMLSQCAGKCDPDKKPHYCSKECQKIDWKNHKPYCLPGAECSVIDDAASSFGSNAPSSKSSAGSLQVPITTPDGSQMTISSSTIGANTLKEIREYASGWRGEGTVHLPSSLNIELERMELEDANHL